MVTVVLRYHTSAIASQLNVALMVQSKKELNCKLYFVL
jgi:hypothetical protein